MIHSFEGKTPRIHESVYVAKNATIIGNVHIGVHSSVWPGAVLRGDFSSITIGKYTSVQDNCVIHSEGSIFTFSYPDYPAVIGDYCTVGHGAVLHGCTIGDRTLIGAHAVIFNNADIGEGSLIGMGCVVPDHKQIPPRSVVVGVPGRVIREVTHEEWEQSKTHAECYAQLAARYKELQL